jgi:hypothetical protein
MRRETTYQLALVDKLKVMFPGCLILKNDPADRQGIPDLLILWGERWAMLEVKRSERSPTQPNQEYYVDHYNQMSFAAFIYPEIDDEVLIALNRFMNS